MSKRLFNKIIVFGIFFMYISFIPNSTFSRELVEYDTETVINDICNQGQYDLIIITPDEFIGNFESLKTHKDDKGIMTKIIGINDISSSIYFPLKGRDDAEQIKYFISNAETYWNIRYVLLVGGKELMPVRYAHFPNAFPTEQNTIISDLYFADLYDENGSFCSWDSNNNSIFGEVSETGEIDQVDLYPDVYIGRLLCSNKDEVDRIVNKIIAYENIVYDESWLNNVLLIGGDTHPVLIDEMLLMIMYRTVFDAKCRIALEGEYMCEQISTIMDDKNLIRCYATGSIRPNAQRLTVSNINKAINDGCVFTVFSGHGSELSFSTHYPFNQFLYTPFPVGYTINSIDDLTNGDKLTISIFNCCLCANFEYFQNPIAWKFINNEHGGSIASLGCTTFSWAPPSSYTTNTFNGFLTMDFFRSYSKGMNTLGELWGASISNYLNNETAMLSYMPILHWQHYASIEEWILLGDPSLKIGGYEVI